MTTPIHIDLSKQALADFCTRWGIERLWLFGSVLTDNFRPESDVDVLFELKAGVRSSIVDLLDMKEEMEALCGRAVDLVEVDSIRNPFRREQILRNRVEVYAA